MLRAMVALFAGVAFALPAIATPFTYERVKVAEGIHAFIEGPTQGVVSGNSIVIIGEESVAVVDTGAHPALTRRMIAEIRALTSKPVRYIVNTHWHNDHVAGNATYAREFPGVVIVTHAFTANAIDTVVRSFYGRCEAYRGKQAKRFRDLFEKGTGDDGKPMPAADRAQYGKIAEEAEAILAECRELQYRPVDVAFEKQLTLNLGKREVRVMFLGRANTAGDAVVVVPHAKLLATGDMVVYPIPFAGGSYPGEWAAALRAVEAMEVTTLVPGHGPVMHDMAYVKLMADAMQAIDSQARAAYKPGMALADLRKAIELGTFRARFGRGDEELGEGFDAMAGEALKRVHEALRGALKPEGLPGE
jgi:cyclase